MDILLDLRQDPILQAMFGETLGYPAIELLGYLVIGSFGLMKDFTFWLFGL